MAMTGISSWLTTRRSTLEQTFMELTAGAVEYSAHTLKDVA